MTEVSAWEESHTRRQTLSPRLASALPQQPLQWWQQLSLAQVWAAIPEMEFPLVTHCLYLDALSLSMAYQFPGYNFGWGQGKFSSQFILYNLGHCNTTLTLGP